MLSSNFPLLQQVSLWPGAAKPDLSPCHRRSGLRILPVDLLFMDPEHLQDLQWLWCGQDIPLRYDPGHDSVISAKGHGILLIFGADFSISQVHQSDLQLHPHPQPAVFFVFLQVRIVNHVVIYDIRSGIVASAGFIVQIIIESLFVDPGTAPEFSIIFFICGMLMRYWSPSDDTKSGRTEDSENSGAVPGSTKSDSIIIWTMKPADATIPYRMS